jgi:hypothetical protein
MADANKKRPPTRVVTGAVRLSYVYLAQQAQDDDGEDDGYRCQVLIPKGDEKTLKAMKIAIQHATIKFAKGDKAKAAKLLKHPKFHKPLRNPELEDMEGDQYKGMLFLTAKAYKERPATLLKNGTRVEDPTQIAKHFYSGVWANCSLSFYPFDTKGNKGIAVGLNSLIKNKDDERLDGRANPEDELAEFIDEDDTTMLDDADGLDDDLGLDDDDDGLGMDDDEDDDDFDLDL